MFEKMSLRWVLEHQFVFLKALLFVMMDLTGEVGGANLVL
jgi:transformation/transcription domain-associated protein